MSAFIPNIDRVILLLYGEQGSAKTAFLEMVKMLVDPSGVLTLVFPRSMAEIVQQLDHNFIAYYDNVSVIKDWLSDVLCRAATGTGFTKRQLYTDDDDIHYEFIRSVGISAIHLPGSKPDMLDRSLIAKFAFIRKDLRRKKNEDILPIFYGLRSQLLGYIFDILAKALKIKSEGGLSLDTRSRMADWEEWCEIIARCMGYKDMEFINAYADNTKLQSDLVLEDRPVARAIVKLVETIEEDDEWTGYNTTLLGVLDEIAATQLDLNIKMEKLWPKSASALSRRIGEIKPTLRELDIEIYDTQDSKTRIKTLHIRKKNEGSKMPPIPLVPPEPASRDKDKSSGKSDTSGVLQPSYSTDVTDYFDADRVEIVNIHKTLAFSNCDVYIGRNWKKAYGIAPLAGLDGQFGNPYVMDEDGGHDGSRCDVLEKYEEWLKRGKEVVNGYDPEEYRHKVRSELPGFYKWGCHCKPKACHGDILKKWLKRQLQIQRARKKYSLTHPKGGDTK